MLMKTVNGKGTKMIHGGGRYTFQPNEVKDCPESMLSAFRGVLVAVNNISPPIHTMMIMPIIRVNNEIDEPKVKKVIKTKKKK